MKRLFLGGPYDGEVLEVEEPSVEELPDPTDADSWIGSAECKDTHLYRLRGVHVTGGTVHAMISEEEDVAPTDPRLHREKDGVEFRPYTL